MEIKEFEKKFSEELVKNKICDIRNIEKYYQYMNLLLEWNEKINLTAIKDENEFIIKHFIDSLTVNKYIQNANRIIDIGTGAGFPGIPLKITNENKEITLIDSVGKKINVIKEIIEELSLKKIEAIHIRAEDYARKNRESFDIAVSRAVANLNTLVEYLIPFVKINGIIICMKGPNYEKEIEESKNAIKVLGGTIEKVDNLIINNELERNIIIIKKVRKTPEQFPRGQSKPLKNPIK